MIAVIAAGLLSAAEPPASAQPNEVEEVVVAGERPQALLHLVVAGDVSRDTYVASAPLGMACGGPTFLSGTGGERQCWLRVRRGQTVYLGATSPGVFGRDWTVDWAGCRPVSNGSACELALGEDANVGAVFRRLRP